jgi:hypothetical protein
MKTYIVETKFGKIELKGNHKGDLADALASYYDLDEGEIISIKEKKDENDTINSTNDSNKLFSSFIQRVFRYIKLLYRRAF